MFNGRLNELCKEANRRAKQKGFWDDRSEATLALVSAGASTELVNAVNDAFISQKIALTHGELSEMIESRRMNHFGIGRKDTFEDEIADALLRLFDLCAELKIDIEKQIMWKMAYNQNREHKHGKRF